MLNWNRDRIGLIKKLTRFNLPWLMTWWLKILPLWPQCWPLTESSPITSRDLMKNSKLPFFMREINSWLSNSSSSSREKRRSVSGLFSKNIWDVCKSLTIMTSRESKDLLLSLPKKLMLNRRMNLSKSGRTPMARRDCERTPKTLYSLDKMMF